MTLLPPPAVAIMSGDESPRAESGDKDYAAGKRAFEHEDWSAVVDNMKKVLERRPKKPTALWPGTRHD